MPARLIQSLLRPLRRHWVLALLMVALPGLPQSALATPVFINELHYDNIGGDVNEGVEIAGPAGTSLVDWSLYFYNGSSGGVYRTVGLMGVIPDLDAGFGVLDFAVSGLQNGAPDGLALANAMGDLMQFLSYEGSFTGVGGVADGITSADIGVAETSSTPPGASLQLFGMGQSGNDFLWRTAVASFGEINPDQRFSRNASSVPVPGTLLLGALGIVLLCRRIRVQSGSNPAL